MRHKHRKSRQRTKYHAELVHFQNRCLQRVGVLLSQNKLKEQLFKEQKNGEFVSRLSLSKSEWLYRHTDGREFFVIYDKKRKRFVTIIPKDRNSKLRNINM